MKLPRPKRFTIEELAMEWGVDASEVNRLIERGQLELSALYASRNGMHEYWEKVFPERKGPIEDKKVLFGFDNQIIMDVLRKGQYVKLEEVERFEKDHGLAVVGVQDEGQPERQKKSEDFVSELLAAGEDPHVVAAKLRANFQETRWHIATLLNIRPDLPNAESRKTAAKRFADKGDKMLAGREEKKV